MRTFIFNPYKLREQLKVKISVTEHSNWLKNILLGCDYVWRGRLSPAFWRILLHPSSAYHEEGVSCFLLHVDSILTTCRNISEGINFHSRRLENLRSVNGTAWRSCVDPGVSFTVQLIDYLRSSVNSLAAQGEV